MLTSRGTAAELLPPRPLDDASALAIERSRAAAVRLWDEITQLLVGDPFASREASKPGKPTR